MDKKINYRAIPDERPLIRFFIENGLEYSESDEVATDLVKRWIAEEVSASADAGKDAAVDETAARLVGGCVLAKREGRLICDGIATDPSVRGMHVGERMLFTMIDEVRSMGADELYLVARAPGFFAKYGFEPVRREDAPTFFECFSCPQYGVTCCPEVMRLTIQE